MNKRDTSFPYSAFIKVIVINEKGKWGEMVNSYAHVQPFNCNVLQNLVSVQEELVTAALVWDLQKAPSGQRGIAWNTLPIPDKDLYFRNHRWQWIQLQCLD